MAWEIERKFRVRGDAWRREAGGEVCRQGYLSLDPERTVRVRACGGRGTLTVKGISRGPLRTEYEYEIPLADAEALLADLCVPPLIVKTRYRVRVKDLVWEVDVFAGENRGLVLAELELEDSGRQFPLPSWVGEEVTDDPRYFNANLVTHPFQSWENEL
jgi:adenylate cyclase